MYKEIHIVGWILAPNVHSSYKNFFDYFSGLKDMSQKADFEREPMEAHSCYIQRKVVGKGIFSFYIGE